MGREAVFILIPIIYPRNKKVDKNKNSDAQKAHNFQQDLNCNIQVKFMSEGK